MIEELKLTNWKSFGESTLYIEPLTFIIGFNSSGKSNILDALSFLSNLSKGVTIDEAARATRGGEEWLLRMGTSSSTLELKIHDDDSNADYLYQMEICRNDSKFEVCREKLVKQTTGTQILLLETDDRNAESRLLSSTSYTGNRGRRRKIEEVFCDRMPLYQIASKNITNEVERGMTFVLQKLRNIFVFNPIPSLMRNYVPLQTELKEDASNIAGVLAGIHEFQRIPVLERIAQYVRNLPERDIVRIWTETVGLFGKDAMLYCKEKWTNDTELTLDAKGMSDGTLRFIAIVTALLTLPKNTLLLIEEVDNGLHPSRATELVTALKTIGNERSIDVICTTHNPYLIDALGSEMIPCISYIKRDGNTGNSTICLLDEHENLFNIMASGSIGMSMANGRI